MVLKTLFRRSHRAQEAGATLYALAVAQARLPAFYQIGGVPDTVDGRFEMISLHAFLLMHRLKALEGGKDTAQALFDEMFADMDRNLRELGAGDLGVGRRVKTMAKAFYGRVAAYEAGLEGGQAKLREAFTRNLYGTAEAPPEAVEAMAAYAISECAALALALPQDLIEGRHGFGPPPSGPAAAGGAAGQ